jgi:hypothetical protein
MGVGAIYVLEVAVVSAFIRVSERLGYRRIKKVMASQSVSCHDLYPEAKH